MRRPSLPTILLGTGLALLLAGCARHARPAPELAPPPPTPVAAAPLPPGASPGMLVPAELPDGRYPTPNQQLSAAGTLWHLRTGLNVAALSCPGAEEAAIRAGYNRWLDTAQAPLARALVAYRTEYGAATPAGRDAFDDAMTRLYNFWSQTPVRPGFCTAAAGLLAELAQPAGTMQPAAALATLDAPFVDFYRAYDAWRRGIAARPVIAAAAPAGPIGTPAPRRAALVLDLSSLPVDTEVSGGR